jgi:hypothetical protein
MHTRKKESMNKSKEKNKSTESFPEKDLMVSLFGKDFKTMI